MAESGPQSHQLSYGNVPNSTRKRPFHLMHSQYPPDLGRQATTRQVDRSKVSRACDACKKRKTRCSGVQPCIRCQEWGITCEYTAVYTRGRQPDIPTASARPPNAAEVRSVDGPSAYHPTGGPLQVQLPDTSFDQDKPPLTGQSSRNSPVPNTDIQGHYHGPSSALTFLERAWKRINKSHASTFLSNLGPATEEAGRLSDPHTLVQAERLIDTCRLPTQQGAMQLIETHFEVTTPFYRFLHRGVVESWVKLVYQGPEGSVNLHRRRSLARKLAVLLMIFAEATSYGEDTDEGYLGQSIHQSEQYYTDACHYLQGDLGSPTLESVQARLLECFYLLSTPRENEVYSKFGVLVSMAITIGLHRQKRRNGYKHEIGVLEHECRKRAFWAIYILDRYLSVMGGRPRLLQDRDLDQDLPASLNDDVLDADYLEPRAKSADSVMSAPNAHAKLACIIGRNSHEMYPLQANTLDERIACVKRSTQALETWASELPVLFREVAPSSLSHVFRRQCVMIRVAHAHAVIHANRPFLLIQFSAMKNHMISRGQGFNFCIDNCVMAARGVLESLDCLTEDDTVFQRLWFIQYVSFCAIAVIYIHIMVQRQQQNGQPDNVGAADPAAERSKNRDFRMTEHWQKRLAQIAPRNSAGLRYAIILEEIRREVVRYEEPTPSTIMSGVDGFRGQVPPDTPADVSPSSLQSPRDQEESSFTTDADINLTQMFDSWGLLDYAQLDYTLSSAALEAQP